MPSFEGHDRRVNWAVLARLTHDKASAWHVVLEIRVHVPRVGNFRRRHSGVEIKERQAPVGDSIGRDITLVDVDIYWLEQNAQERGRDPLLVRGPMRLSPSALGLAF